MINGGRIKQPYILPNHQQIKGANIYNEQNHPFFLLLQGAKMQKTKIWF
jgi:hypothetical protein